MAVVTHRATTAFAALALLLAAYRGFRMPGDWAATLEAVSVTDGFHRRFLVGTLLHPLALATGYAYWVFAAAAFAVLLALLAVLATAFFRARHPAHRLVVAGWLLLPSGGFLFHEVGYFDQALYLLLFVALWQLPRRPAVASGLMTAAVFAHEIAALTVLPVFAVVLLRRFSVRITAKLLVTPVAAELGVLALPASSPGAADRLRTAMAGADFTPRADALALFERSQSESWRLYSITEVLLLIAPILVVVVTGFLLQRRDVLAAAAVAAPALLAFAGWDWARWGFLLVTNFAVVLLLGPARDLRPLPLAVAAVLLASLPLPYFDAQHPRELNWRVVSTFADQAFSTPRGKRTVNTAPPSLCTASDPPCATTFSRAIARPSPLPSVA
ncbi:hypothetical protein DV20_40980 [Amycolatopsis rifamycinica]|uniref:Uncharacterized protein n=1 Tax=Amycolatopsis rifamycinica TaxID=287986 RepID=A0A066TNQ0_9PSEU|nr:hypothetical protein DV20_40980 [Amycolatopsis rifamycinica]